MPWWQFSFHFLSLSSFFTIGHLLWTLGAFAGVKITNVNDLYKNIEVKLVKSNSKSSSTVSRFKMSKTTKSIIWCVKIGLLNFLFFVLFSVTRDAINRDFARKVGLWQWYRFHKTLKHTLNFFNLYLWLFENTTTS